MLSISLFSCKTFQASNSCLFPQQSLGMIQSHVTNFPWWWNQNYSSANYMHCSIKPTVCHCSQFPSKTPACPVKLSSRAFDILIEGHHLSEIRLGTNVTFEVFRWFKFTLKPPNRIGRGNYNWQFGTLSFGIFWSNLDTMDLETYPRTYSGQFWHMSLFDDSRAVWVFSKNGCSQKIKVFSMKEQSLRGVFDLV